MSGALRFNGPNYDPDLDGPRLERQHERIRDLMLDGRWRTVAEIAERTGDPENSIQAQLRHLRKPRFGAFIVEKRYRGDRGEGLYEYHVRHRRADEPAPEHKPRSKGGLILALADQRRRAKTYRELLERLAEFLAAPDRGLRRMPKLSARIRERIEQTETDKETPNDHDPE